MGLKSVYQTSQIVQTTNIRDDGTAETHEAILSKLLFCHGKTEAPTEMISPSWNQLTSFPVPNPVCFPGPTLLLLPYPTQTLGKSG